MQWVRERLYIPAAEWEELLEAIGRDHELDTAELTEGIEERLFRLKRSHLSNDKQDTLWAIVALENLIHLEDIYHLLKSINAYKE